MNARIENRRVLCVDDEPNVLEALERTLGGAFDVTVASSGRSALALIEAGCDFAVIVSDMRMPEMDGAALLATVAARAPATVRVLLTGQTDVGSAIAAVNKGRIFQFLQKPCHPDLLLDVLEHAVLQHQLVTAERDVLERTLNGTVQLLADALALAAPTAFARARDVSRLAKQVTTWTHYQDAWTVEVAALLCMVGCLVLPPDVVERVLKGRSTEADRRTFETHPDAGWKLLSRVPRLEAVAEIVLRQRRDVEGPAITPAITTGAAILRLALDVDARVAVNGDLAAALAAVHGRYPAALIEPLHDLIPTIAPRERDVGVAELVSGMRLVRDVRARNGMLVAAAGTVLSQMVVSRLGSFAEGVGLVLPLRVTD